MTITKSQAKQKALETFMRLADTDTSEALHAAFALLNYALPPVYPAFPPPVGPAPVHVPDCHQTDDQSDE